MYWGLWGDDKNLVSPVPFQDSEMDIEEVEAALQQINNRLITEKEFQYIYFVSNK